MNDKEEIKLILLCISEQEKYLYETFRPTREMDARVIMVSLTAISLITTCLASGEIHLNTGTTDILLSNWLYLGVPLLVVLLYWVWELICVWRLTKIRIYHALDNHLKTTEQLDKYKDKYNHDLNKTMSIEPMNDNLSEWYDTVLNILGVFRPIDEKQANLLLKARMSLDNEYKHMRREVDGKDIHDKDKVQQSILDELADIHNIIYEVLDKQEFLFKGYKQREVLSVIIPIILALFALLIFLVKLFFPQLLLLTPV